MFGSTLYLITLLSSSLKRRSYPIKQDLRMKRASDLVFGSILSLSMPSGNYLLSSPAVENSRSALYQLHPF